MIKHFSNVFLMQYYVASNAPTFRLDEIDITKDAIIILSNEILITCIMVHLWSATRIIIINYSIPCCIIFTLPSLCDVRCHETC